MTRSNTSPIVISGAFRPRPPATMRWTTRSGIRSPSATCFRRNSRPSFSPIPACAPTFSPTMPTCCKPSGGRLPRRASPRTACRKCCRIPIASASRRPPRPHAKRAKRAHAEQSLARRAACFDEPTRDVLRLRRGTDITLSRGVYVPVESALEILRHAVAMLVKARDDVLRAGVAVLRSRLVPFRGELPILGRAAAEEILRRELDLSLGVTLLRGFLPPLGRACERPRHADAAFEAQPQAVLSLRHPRLGRFGDTSPA